MMIRIFIFIFSIFLFCLEASPREEKRKSQEDIIILIKGKQYNEVIPKIEAFILKYPYEKKMVVNLARSLLRRTLDVPVPEDDAFTREEKWKQAQKNYQLANQIFERIVKEWIDTDPKESELGLWIFEWGLTEHLLGKKERAIQVYLLATKYPNFPVETLYNIAILKEELALTKEAERYFKLYKTILEKRNEQNKKD